MRGYVRHVGVTGVGSVQPYIRVRSIKLFIARGQPAMYNVPCIDCADTGIVPCGNCEESDEHECWIDGEMYGPYPCDCNP